MTWALKRTLGIFFDKKKDLRNYSGGMVTPQKIKSHIGWEDFKGVTWVLSSTLIHF